MGCRWGAKLQEVSPAPAQAPPLSSPHLEGPPSQAPSKAPRGLVQQGSVPSLLACIWHQLKNLPPPLILAPPWLQGLWWLIPARFWLETRACWVRGSQRWEVDCWSSRLWLSEQTSRPKSPGWTGRGWDLTVAHGYKGLQGLAAQHHLAQGAGTLPSPAWDPAGQSGPGHSHSFLLGSLKWLSWLLSAFICLVLPLRMTPGTAAAAFPMLLF